MTVLMMLMALLLLMLLLMVMMQSVTQSTHNIKVYPFDVAVVEIWKFLAYSLARVRILRRVCDC